MRPAQTPLRVLIVRVGAMGDVLHALPAVAALRRARPDVAIDWVVDQRWEPLLAGDSGDDLCVRRTFAVDIKAWKRKPFSASTLSDISSFRKLRGKYDIVVDMQGTMRSAAIARLAGGRSVAGYADPRERAAAWLYTRKLTRCGVHVAQQGAALLAEATRIVLNVGANTSSAEPVMIPRTRSAEVWAEREAVHARPLALLAPGAGWKAKRWPADRFAALAIALRAQGWDVVVNASRADDPLSSNIAVRSQGAGRVVVCDVAGLIALMRRADLFVGGDSGPLHLAAMLAVPLVALFGPTSPDRNGPWGPGAQRVLRDPASQTSYKRRAEVDPGLARISVDDVLAAVAQVTTAPSR